jgi:rhodanese-related sulfurtransferase
MKRPIVQAVIIILASLVLALTANALASRQRKVTLVGWYPNATTGSGLSRPDEDRRLKPAATQQASSQTAPTPAPMPAATTAEAAVATQTVAPTPQPVKLVVKPTTTTANSQRPTANVPDILARFQQHPDKPYIEIAFDDVNALHGKGVLFLDARRTSVYEQGHIAGARPFSVWESDIDDKVRKLFDERSDAEAQARPIVIYCSGGDCEDSHMLAQKLWGIQFNNVYVYKDGFPDWQKKGGAIHTGSNP